jgi:hypothetical protein
MRERETGGFFELEVRSFQGHFHPEAIRLNGPVQAFQLLLASSHPTRVLMPRYICPNMLRPLEALGIAYRFYSINADFELNTLPRLEPSESLYYVNHFGLKEDYAAKLAARYGRRLILDNSQALFARPLPGIDTLYSPSQFVGVGDGGYWQPADLTMRGLAAHLPQASSQEAFLFLAGRLDESAGRYLARYQAYQRALARAPVMAMSSSTSMLLAAIDYPQCIQLRRRNFRYLHRQLANSNLLPVACDGQAAPLAYPLLTTTPGLRERLIADRIYADPELSAVKQRPGLTALEFQLVNELVVLPVDQRCTARDMAWIVQQVRWHTTL